VKFGIDTTLETGTRTTVKEDISTISGVSTTEVTATDEEDA
jgi:hypothetical protein